MPGSRKVWSEVLSFITSRTGRILAQGTVLSALVGGAIAYTDSGKSLTLVVDGQARKISTDASSVSALLADQAVPVAANDLVAPAPQAAPVEGQDVVVRYARPLTVTVDGKATTHTTTELTLDAALSSLGLDVRGAELSVPVTTELPRTGLSVTVTTPKQVTVVAAGAKSAVTSTATTVSELLTDQKIAVGPSDRVSVGKKLLTAPAATPVVKGMQVTVVKVSTKQVTVTEPVAFTVTKTKDATLTKGSTKIVTKGVAGQRKATYTFTYGDGRRLGRELTRAEVTKQPVTQLVKVGTKAAPASDGPNEDSSGGSSSGGSSSGGSSSGGSSSGGSSSGGSSSGSSSTGTKADSLNWAALAKCESGGNPKAVNPAGYYGLYQFSKSTWRSVGGSGNPAAASSAEQTLRAKKLYNKAGAGQWPVCGRKLFT